MGSLASPTLKGHINIWERSGSKEHSLAFYYSGTCGQNDDFTHEDYLNQRRRGWGFWTFPPYHEITLKRPPKPEKGQFQYGLWLKVVVKPKGENLDAPKLMIVHFNFATTWQGQRKFMEFVGENEVTVGANMIRCKAVVISEMRNISVKRSLQGENKVCNPIGSKKTKSGSSESF
ncbi:hypothetical protein V6N11_031632 [Hibiscus sabdariffa]|uniref:Uncharacterized protein n=1 Tax=Hibiscus sabdariffa TaxID=183260 RepID=A0ABR2SZ14_9ROSI